MKPGTLAEWLAYLEQLHPQAIDMGLERVRQVADRLGLTRPAPRVITVTGTNGKGSTSALLAALLRAAGCRVGLYSSPHLRHYNERILVDGRPASEVELCQVFAFIERTRGDISLTYFEFGTLAALMLFQAAGLDAVVLEVGLGGRLDAVNLIDPDLAIVTSIGLDHSEWLGNSRESVAREKAGIFRAGIPVVCNDAQPPYPLLEAAARLAAPMRVRGVHYSFRETDEGTWAWQGCDRTGKALSLPSLPPLSLPLENAATALQALMLLEDLPDIRERIPAVLKATRLTGRFDRRRVYWKREWRELMLDVGHNPHAAQYLARYLEQHRPQGRWHAVFGLLADKDVQGVLKPLLPLIDRWALVTLDSPRARSAQSLAETLQEQGALVSQHDNLALALEAQLEQSTANDRILVFGSFYCVADGLTWLDQQIWETVDDVAG